MLIHIVQCNHQGYNWVTLGHPPHSSPIQYFH
ncbi:hypothetical protein EC950183_3486, partial [Escherichia coli 95.0183]